MDFSGRIYIILNWVELAQKAPEKKKKSLFGIKTKFIITELQSSASHTENKPWTPQQVSNSLNKTACPVG